MHHRIRAFDQLYSSSLLFLLSFVVIVTQGLKEPSYEEILQWKAPKKMSVAYPYFIAGVDKVGAPVIAVELGRWDIRAIMEKPSDSKEVKNFQKYTLQAVTRAHESPKLLNATRNEYIIIVDLDGFESKQYTHVPTVGKLVEIARQFAVTARHSRRLKKVYCVNSNYPFQNVYTISKPVLGSLASQIELYGTKPDAWKPILLKEIDKSQLPVWLGGDADYKPLKIYG